MNKRIFRGDFVMTGGLQLQGIVVDQLWFCIVEHSLLSTQVDSVVVYSQV